jgi:hypothetical protein
MSQRGLHRTQTPRAGLLVQICVSVLWELPASARQLLKLVLAPRNVGAWYR